jgi:hypothetical protein
MCKVFTFLISNFRRVLHVVCFLLGNSLASEFYMPTFRNTLFHLHRHVSVKILHTYLPMKIEQCSETSAYKNQTPGNYPEESIQDTSIFFKRSRSVVGSTQPSIHGMPGIQWLGKNLTTPISSKSRLKMNGAIPPLPHTPS